MSDTSSASAPQIGDIRHAAQRIAGAAVVTPLLENADLNAATGARVLIKPETLQRTGSFKFRGAYNRLSRLSGAEKRNGVVAFSSGNHAQGVAAAAALLEIPAVIVMPSDTPQIKVERTRAYGGELVFYERRSEDRAEIAASLASQRGAVLVPPFDDGDIIAGQGTVGLELIAQASAAGAVLDAVLIPCGGGGLAAGCALALHAESPATAIYIVEPVGFDDTARSLEAGERVANEGAPVSNCDALLVPSPGELTFAINRELVTGAFTVTDREVAAAMVTAFRDLKLVVEPGGAVALAAVLTGRFDAVGKTVAVVCSGGNVDPGLLCRALGAAQAV